jgi:glycolate oxidase iron-sulfur subunit
LATVYDSLKEVKAELMKCMKCGNCQEVCPIYLEVRREPTVARGKIKLVEAVLDENLAYQIGDGFAEKLVLCLTCKACNAKCPCGVKVDKIILAARAAIAREKGLHPMKKMIFSVLKRGGLFDLGLRTGAFFQGLAFKKHPTLSAGSPRFPVGLDMRRVVPPLASTPLRQQFPQEIKAQNPVKRVALFTGCVMNYVYTDQGKAIIDVLKENNVEVVIPEGQLCCGAPVYIHGDVETAREMAKANIDAFNPEKFDYLITACGTCGGSWQHYYQELLAEDKKGYGAKAAEIGKKTMDIADFIVKVIGLDPAKLGPVERTVTYHDPCHLNRGMGVSKSPREILKAIPGLTFKEMKNADRCCGGAGSFSLTHYDLSMDIHKHKTEAIKATGASQVVTGCGACRMQLTDGFNRGNVNLEAVHTIMLLAESYRNRK